MWTILLKTLSVSIVALLLLIIKKIFVNHLSPRWQYAIWTLLALRILIPVSMTKIFLLPIPLWLETLKYYVELGLDSVYTTSYLPIQTGSAFITESISNLISKTMPQSITDWLFIIYLIGIVVCLLWYISSYCRLRYLLQSGIPATPSQIKQINSVCEKYHLKSCKAIAVSGLHSAFICGIFRPVLVLPEENETNDMVLLHELLHLKYFDALQNIFWCILRTLHWCNPFLHYVFNQIENDMESLCDQRVLELLEGEERREYGKILLSMANEKFARTPGTTSLSNGGKNIAKRITAIVHFKKFPKGIALVSICILILLGNSIIIGNATTYKNKDYFPETNRDIAQSFAVSRLNRCTTIAGALSTYAKGVIYKNNIYLATASPLSKQDELLENYSNTSTGFYDDGYYEVYNLMQTSENHYEALLCISKTGYNDELEIWENEILILPLEVFKEGNDWVVEKNEALDIIYPDIKDDDNFNFYKIESYLPNAKQYTLSGKTGTLTFSLRTSHSILEYYQTDVDNIFSSNSQNTYSTYNSYRKGVPNTSAMFNVEQEHLLLTFECNETATHNLPTKSIAIQIKPATSLEEVSQIRFPNETFSEYTGGSSSDGYHWTSETITDDWNKTISLTAFTYTNFHNQPNKSAHNFWLVRILYDGEEVELFTIDVNKGGLK